MTVSAPVRVPAPDEPIEVTTGKVREFACAIGELGPVHHDVAAARAAGHPGLVAPPTFAMVPLLPFIEAALDEVGIDRATDAVLHTEQRFDYHRPLCAGDAVRCVVRADRERDTTAADGTRVLGLDIRAELRVADEVRVTVRTRLLVRFGAAGKESGE
ncbi:FAS1-like dehydratase domain-containing protein [Nocardia sp. NPDC003482]